MTALVQVVRDRQRLSRPVPIEGRQAPVTDWALLRPVLELMADGFTYDEIAALLHLSAQGVKSRARSLCALLGARDKAHAVAIGFRKGLLELEASR
jgi:DNA-binding NarL/FixJ family response regulator